MPRYVKKGEPSLFIEGRKEPTFASDALAITSQLTCPAKRTKIEVEKKGLHDPVKAGLTSVFSSQQTQLSISRILPLRALRH